MADGLGWSCVPRNVYDRGSSTPEIRIRIRICKLAMRCEAANTSGADGEGEGVFWARCDLARSLKRSDASSTLAEYDSSDPDPDADPVSTRRPRIWSGWGTTSRPNHDRVPRPWATGGPLWGSKAEASCTRTEMPHELSKAELMTTRGEEQATSW